MCFFLLLLGLSFLCIPCQHGRRASTFDWILWHEITSCIWLLTERWREKKKRVMIEIYSFVCHYEIFVKKQQKTKWKKIASQKPEIWKWWQMLHNMSESLNRLIVTTAEDWKKEKEKEIERKTKLNECAAL